MLLGLMLLSVSACSTLSGSADAWCLTNERPVHTEAEILAADRETLIEWADDLDQWVILCGD